MLGLRRKGVIMNNVHHRPGRLRLKFPELKNRPDLAKGVESTMRELNGVGLVQTNTFTGTLLIHYTARGQQEQELLDHIGRKTLQLGISLRDDKTGASQHAPLPASANHIVETLVGMAIEKCLERYGLNLLSVLL
jgi:hypothetical protein